MIPSNARLIEGGRKTVAELKASAPASDQALLTALDSVFVELHLRDDETFFASLYQSGYELAGKGGSLVSQQLPGTSLAQMAGFRELTPPEHVGQARGEIATLRQVLSDLVKILAIPAIEKKPEVAALLAEVVDWENRLLVRHHQVPEAKPPESRSKYFTRENLYRYLSEKFPEWGRLTLENVRVLTGGFSKTTVLFDMTSEARGKESLVIRAEQPPLFGFWPGDQVGNEFYVLQLVYEAGLCVPEPLWLETDASQMGQPFLVSRRAPGDNVGNSAGTGCGVTRETLEDVVRHLVAIHKTKLDTEDSRVKNSHLARWASFKTLNDSTPAWVDYWIAAVERKQLRPSPLTTRLFAWLKNNVPDCGQKPSLLHGDFGLHNILVEDGKVSSILDWEYLGYGDPAEDIAMLYITLGGSVSKEEIVKLYNQAGGEPISEYRLRYFDVIYAMKYIVPTENALQLYQDNESADFKLCHFGFVYPYVGVGTLNEKIALAEAARSKE